MKERSIKRHVGEIIDWFIALVVFILPFVFMLLNSLKDRRGANKLALTLPETFEWGNYSKVLTENNFQVLRAFKNSFLLIILSVAVLVIFGAMAGYVLQRRRSRVTAIGSTLLMTGLMIPASILPTIWVLQALHIYQTLFAMVMIEAALNFPFTIMLFRGFMDTIPKELEEAAMIDGCNKGQIFYRVVFPLLKPVTSTVIILNAVTIFNDFTNPLYFWPGTQNTTVQLTLYTYLGQYASSYNMLFADVILITIPMLILFLIFNKKIIDGMVAGAVKG